MLITKQQKFLLRALERVGGLREAQMISLIRPVFCAEKPDVAPQVVAAALRQFSNCNVELRDDGGVIRLQGTERPNGKLLDAVDVMLQLAGTGLADYWRGNPPVLLRFCVQAQKVRTFSVAVYGQGVFTAAFPPHERIILLFDGQGQPQALPVSNKQFIAVRQENETYRFFALDGKKQT